MVAHRIMNTEAATDRAAHSIELLKREATMATTLGTTNILKEIIKTNNNNLKLNHLMMFIINKMIWNFRKTFTLRAKPLLNAVKKKTKNSLRLSTSEHQANIVRDRFKLLTNLGCHSIWKTRSKKQLISVNQHRYKVSPGLLHSRVEIWLALLKLVVEKHYLLFFQQLFMSWRNQPSNVVMGPLCSLWLQLENFACR